MFKQVNYSLSKLIQDIEIGGPLVNVEGKMIGLNIAYISSRGIAIIANKVKTISEQLAKDGEIKIACA